MIVSVIWSYFTSSWSYFTSIRSYSECNLEFKKHRIVSAVWSYFTSVWSYSECNLELVSAIWSQYIIMIENVHEGELAAQKFHYHNV